jgi:hypothetical protein
VSTRSFGFKGQIKVFICLLDACPFFAALSDLVVVGPTGTNVNDFRAILRSRGGSKVPTKRIHSGSRLQLPVGVYGPMLPHFLSVILKVGIRKWF